MALFGLFESAQTKDVVSHIKNLVAIAKMDGDLAKVEVDKIIEIGLSKGLSAKKVRKIIKSEPEAVEITGTRDEKFDKLYDIIAVIAADGVLDESEMRICEKLAVNMGFSNVVSGVMIRQLFNGVIAGKNRDKIKAEAETFLTY